MPEIKIKSGDLTASKTDAIVIPSDVELTNRKANKITEKILDTANKDLLNEISSIGYCEVGNAVITQGYNLGFKHIIYMPYFDSSNEDNSINYVILHKAVRSVFNLASLYNVETIGIPLIKLDISKFSYLNWLNKLLLISKHVKLDQPKLTSSEIEDVIIGVASEFSNSSIKEVVLYR